MTTAVHPSVDWVRLTIGDTDLTLAPSPGIELRLLVGPVPPDERVDLLAAPRPPQIRIVVDLLPATEEAVFHCEAKARQVAAHLGADGPASDLLREFAVEAALGGEGLPYNRVSAPRLTLSPDSAAGPDFDAELPSVRVFTATAHPGSDGSKYVLTQAD